MPSTSLDPLDFAGVVGLAVVLGWLAGLMTRNGATSTRLVALAVAVAAAVIAAITHACMSRWDVVVAGTEAATAAGGVVVGWWGHRYWNQCVRVIATRTRSKGVAHGDPRR
jgi:hypothetical protein